MYYAAMSGFAIGIGLAFTVGPLGIFVLHQGILRNCILTICLIGLVSDVILIFLGVYAFRSLSRSIMHVEPLLRYGSGVFLILYGVSCFRLALHGRAVPLAGQTEPPARLGIAVTCLAFIWLNPQVYMETVLVGAVSARHPGMELAYALGVVASSAVYFFGLGYGGVLLAPLIRHGRIWRFIDGCSGALMSGLAVTLVL